MGSRLEVAFMGRFLSIVSGGLVYIRFLPFQFFTASIFRGSESGRRAFLLLVLICLAQPAHAYSLLTHEQIIDTLWKNDIAPLLLRRFQGASEEDLRKAHAYAYGGCLIQDMGYYPPGNRFFSDLTHYVRSGDFAANLISESTDLTEYAFALGALAHYCADNSAHPLVNHCVGLTFPKLRKKFGEKVTFEEDPKAHIRVEFGFDVSQISKNRYSSQQYHDFIGFEVSKPVLERAFLKTYGMPLDEVVRPVDLSINTFRRAASKFIPDLTRAALEIHGPEMKKGEKEAGPTINFYHLSRSEYEKEWGKDYSHPTIFARMLALMLKVVPKVGIFKSLAFKMPSPEVEALCVTSANKTIANYRATVRQVGVRIELPNLDCDTGRPSRAGEYGLGDEAYMKLLHQLSQRGFQNVPPDVRENILAYFSEPSEVKPRSSKARKVWRRAVVELEALRDGEGKAPNRFKKGS